MHYPGERCCTPALLPGRRFITETLPRCPAHSELFSNTCHPLSITKSPAPRWPSCPQALPAAAAALAPCPPLVQKCVLLYRQQPCETTRLLPPPPPRREPCPKGSGLAQTLPAARSHKRVARSLPPCAPRCPEPGRLRFPPCGIRSSASCRGECRPRKVAQCPARCPEPTGGYSLPLRGVTECPPQQSLARSFLHECLSPQRCSKGYPTQECVPCYSSEQRLSAAAAKGTEGCPPHKAVAKGSLPREGTKARGSSALHPGKARCGHARGSPRPSRLPSAAAKRSGHSKRSRCASRWLW